MTEKQDAGCGSRRRRAWKLWLTAIVAVAVLAALAVDFGHVMLVRSQLQVAADASAVAAASSADLPRNRMEAVARRFAGLHTAAGRPVTLDSGDVQYGTWNARRRTFIPSSTPGDAVRVISRTGGSGGSRFPRSFAGVLGNFSFARQASAVATARPRDIALVVDLSGTMNDGTASDRTASMQQIYDDLGFGAYPGKMEHVDNAQDEHGYAAIIDGQIRRIMPHAKPLHERAENRAYWAKYVDYVVRPPKTLPPEYHGQIGYRTYVQFMLDHGRDLKPDGSRYTPLSQHAPDCPWHLEDTAGGTFRFPPRTQPMHGVRRALIAAIERLEQWNAHRRGPERRDRIAIITYDTLHGGGPAVVQPLTSDYRAAMVACTRLQAVADRPATAAADAGLIAAEKHFRPPGAGGQGRSRTDKVVVLVTGGAPGLYSTAPAEIDRFIDAAAECVGDDRRDEFYDKGEYGKNAALVQVARMQARNWQIFPSGVGSDADYDFLDRVARLGRTADADGKCPRNIGNPADCEKRLIEMLDQIITTPTIGLAQ